MSSRFRMAGINNPALELSEEIVSINNLKAIRAWMCWWMLEFRVEREEISLKAEGALNTG